jgi:hypothetical protein
MNDFLYFCPTCKMVSRVSKTFQLLTILTGLPIDERAFDLSERHSVVCWRSSLYLKSL